MGGLFLHLYYRLDFYDHIVHVLAGIWAAIAIIAFFRVQGVVFTKVLNIFLITMSFSLIVGVVWEFFELRAGLTSVADHAFLSDTYGDLISDTVGAIIGSLYCLKYFLWNTRLEQ